MSANLSTFSDGTIVATELLELELTNEERIPCLAKKGKFMS